MATKKTDYAAELLKLRETVEKEKTELAERERKTANKILEPAFKELEQSLDSVCVLIGTLNSNITGAGAHPTYLENEPFQHYVKTLKKLLFPDGGPGRKISSAKGTPERVNGAVSYVLKNAKEPMTAEKVLAAIKSLNTKFAGVQENEVQDQLNKKTAKGQANLL